MHRWSIPKKGPTLKTIRNRKIRHRKRVVFTATDTEILLAHLRGEPDPVAAGQARMMQRQEARRRLAQHSTEEETT